MLLLLDRSSSMRGAPLAEARRAAGELVGRSVEGSRIGVAAFDDALELVQPFTEDRARIQAAVDGLVAWNGTALYDALLGAVEIVRTSTMRRRALVVLSDGADENSRRSFLVRWGGGPEKCCAIRSSRPSVCILRRTVAALFSHGALPAFREARRICRIAPS